MLTDLQNNHRTFCNIILSCAEILQFLFIVGVQIFHICPSFCVT